MDLRALHLHGTTQIPFVLKNSYHHENPISWKLGKSSFFQFEDEKVLEIRVRNWRRDHQSYVVRAKKNHENSGSSSSGTVKYILCDYLCLGL